MPTTAGIRPIILACGTSRSRQAPAPSPHKVPDFIATFDGGEDRLFSIEEIVWDGESDRVLLGKGAGLIETPITLTPGGERNGARGDVLDLSHARHGVLIEDSGDGATLSVSDVSAPKAGSYQVAGAEWIIGSPLGDRIHAGPTTRGIEAGSGDDVIEASGDTLARVQGPRGFDLEIDGGAGADTIIAGAGRIAARGGEGADQFVLGSATSELVIEDAEPRDRVTAPQHVGDVRFEVDAGAPDDLLIRVGRGDLAEGVATVRVRNFHDGDLGLVRSDPGSWKGPGSWKADETSIAAVAADPAIDPAMPSRPSMFIGDGAFLYPDSGDAPSSLEPEFWWAAPPLADAATSGYLEPDAAPGSQTVGPMESLWHAAWTPPEACEMDEGDPCSW